MATEEHRTTFALDSRSEAAAWSEQVYFVPFVGPEYERGLRDGVRVLLLGDSHYRDEGQIGLGCGRDCTLYNFDGYLDEAQYEKRKSWSQFFQKLAALAALKPEPTPAEAVAAWRRIAYANAVQTFMDQPRKSPTRKQYDQAAVAIREMVVKLRPHVVLVLGVRLWNHLPDELGDYGDEAPLSGSSRRVWLLNADAWQARTSWIYHPSTQREPVASAIEVLRQLLERAAQDPEPGAGSLKMACTPVHGAEP